MTAQGIIRFYNRQNTILLQQYKADLQGIFGSYSYSS